MSIQDAAVDRALDDGGGGAGDRGAGGGPAVEHVGGEEAEDEGGHRDQRHGRPARAEGTMLGKGDGDAVWTGCMRATGIAMGVGYRGGVKGLWRVGTTEERKIERTLKLQLTQGCGVPGAGQRQATLPSDERLRALRRVSSAKQSGLAHPSCEAVE